MRAVKNLDTRIMVLANALVVLIDQHPAPIGAGAKMKKLTEMPGV
jgi:hypothetical protein